MNEAFPTFIKFRATIETTIGMKTKLLQSEWGGVFLSKEFQDFLDQNDIFQQFIQANMFHFNNVTTRKNAC
jgi:hypothetical protein